MRLRTQCLLLCATTAAALQLQPAPQLAKRPHQQPRVILTTEQVEKLERSVAAALPAVGQWAAFGGVVSAFSGCLWGYAGLPAAALYASSVASGTAWALAWDHVMPGGGRRVAEMMGGTTVGVPCSVRDAVVPTRAEINLCAMAFRQIYYYAGKDRRGRENARAGRVHRADQGTERVRRGPRARPRRRCDAGARGSPRPVQTQCRNLPRSRLDDVPRVDSVPTLSRPSSHTTPSPRRASREERTPRRRRELEAVVAHEVGHLKHGDTGRAAQAAAMLSGLSTAKRAGDRMLANKRKEKSDASVAAALAAAGAASSAAGLLLRLA